MWDKPGSLPHATWGAVWASLTFSGCGRTDSHRTCSGKESCLETESRLLPETPAFLSMKSWVPWARSGARFNLKAGAAFHYCPLFTSGSLKQQDRAEQSTSQVLLSGYKLLCLSPWASLSHLWCGWGHCQSSQLSCLQEEDPAPEKEGEADLLVQRVLVWAWTEHGKWATPMQGLMRSREVALAQRIWISASCPSCLVAREDSMLDSPPAEIKVSFLPLEKAKTFKASGWIKDPTLSSSLWGDWSFWSLLPKTVLALQPESSSSLEDLHLHLAQLKS